jgi:hypothetical protein
VRVCVHRGECPYVYEYLHLYCVSQKKILKYREFLPISSLEKDHTLTVSFKVVKVSELACDRAPIQILDNCMLNMHEVENCLGKCP